MARSVFRHVLQSICFAFFLSPLPKAPRADEAVPAVDDLTQAKEENAKEIREIESKIDQLDDMRKDAVRRRQMQDAKQLAAEIRAAKIRLQTFANFTDEDLLVRFETQRKTQEAALKAAEAQIAVALADQLAVERGKHLSEKYGPKFDDARVEAGCPLVVSEINTWAMTRERVDSHINHGAPGYMWFDGQYVPGTPREGYYVRVTVVNTRKEPLTAWEVRVEQVNSFNETIGYGDHQGGGLGTVGERFVIRLPSVDNTAGVRVTAMRAVLPDGKVWLRNGNHMGVSIRKTTTTNGRLVSDVEDFEEARGK